MLSPGSGTAPLPPPGMGTSDTTDAWSLSLQKFTSLSLQEDFLAADSARKQTRPPPGMAALAGAEDYDIKEKNILSPPPGLPPGLGGGIAKSAPIPPTQDIPFSQPQSNILPPPSKMKEVEPMVDPETSSLIAIPRSCNTSDDPRRFSSTSVRLTAYPAGR